jgi:hypothetical protein
VFLRPALARLKPTSSSSMVISPRSDSSSDYLLVKSNYTLKFWFLRLALVCYSPVAGELERLSKLALAPRIARIYYWPINLRI